MIKRNKYWFGFIVPNNRRSDSQLTDGAYLHFQWNGDYSIRTTLTKWENARKIPAANLGCGQNVSNAGLGNKRQSKVHFEPFSDNAKRIGSSFFLSWNEWNDRRLYFSFQSIRHEDMHFALISNDERFVNETLNVFHYAASWHWPPRW